MRRGNERIKESTTNVTPTPPYWTNQPTPSKVSEKFQPTHQRQTPDRLGPSLKTKLIKPIISTNWSGHVDFLNPEFVPLCGGQLEDVHPTAKNEWIIEGSKWFKVDLGNVGFFLNDVFNNYKNYKNKANRQGFFSRSNFSFEKMVEQLKDTLNRNVPKLTSQVELKLPKLNLPKKKLPELKLPNLKKVKA